MGLEGAEKAGNVCVCACVCVYGGATAGGWGSDAQKASE